MGYVQMGLLAVVLFGDSVSLHFVQFIVKIFRTLNMPPPAFVSSLRANMMPAFVGFMVLGSVAQNLQATGAFEVCFVWDDPETGIRLIGNSIFYYGFSISLGKKYFIPPGNEDTTAKSFIIG